MPALPSIYTPFDTRYQNPGFNQQTGQQGFFPTSGTGVGGSLPGAPATGYTPTAGGIPQVPNPVQTAGQAIGGNLGNLGQIGQLAQGIGPINAQLGRLPYQQNLPNYAGLLGNASTNALQNLQGRLPQDVVNQLQQSAAERGISTGSPGSPNSNASYLRALGLTSLGQQQAGLSQFGTLMGLTPTGPQFNPASMFVDPNSQQQAQAAANLYNSAPIPQYAQNAAFGALQNGLRQGRGATSPQNNPTMDTLGNILGKYAPTVGGGTPSPSAPPGSGQGSSSTGAFNDLTGEYQDYDPNDPLAGLQLGSGSGDNLNIDQLYPDLGAPEDIGSPEGDMAYYG